MSIFARANRLLATAITLAIGVLVFLAFPAVGQRGKIIKAATTFVMDPNHDGFVSKTSAGFSDKGFNGYYVKEFEFPMFGIPIVGSGEALGDNQAGPSCGITDITVDSLGYGAYAVIDNLDNLIFRFRLGNTNPSVEAYTILIDTDGKIGPDDPNATPDNPGFEIDITLIKNNSKGVYIYNIDGIESCPTQLKNYSFASNFQISIGDIISCNDPDYFYDFFVPFGDLQTLFGITKNTELRFVAVTNVSATCAMSGKIADIGGVDDTLYAGCNTCAFLDLGNNQCPTSLNNLCANCTGFQTGVTPKPTINVPVKAGEFTVSGTAIPSSTVFVDLFNAAHVLKQSVTTTTGTGCTACPWSATFSIPLAFSDIISAKAKSTTGCQSGGVSSDATVTIVVNNIPPVITGAIGVLTYLENDPPLKVEGNISLTDPDNINLHHATVSIITNFSAGEDILSFTTTAGISGSYNPATGIINFTGIAPLTSYQALLRSVSYSNSSENPSTLARTVRMVVNDALDNSNLFDRQINVVRVNDAPVANNDNGITNEENPVIIPNLIINDTDVDGTVDATTIDLDPTTAGKQSNFTNATGTWVVNAAAALTFTPALNFNGSATRTYTVNDNLGALSNVAVITVTVNPVNDPPVATNDSGTTNEDTPVTLSNITSNDTDVDGTIDVTTVDLDPVTGGKQISFTNVQGTWTVDAAGAVTYGPALNFNGTATRTYVVNDNSGATSSVATISIVVNAVNDPPVANNDNGTTNEDTPVIVPNVTANDSDVDGTVDATTVDLNPATPGKQTSFSNAEGSWSVNAAAAITFTPSANFNGTATISYVVNDNSGATSNSATLTIVVNPVNDPPVAVDLSGTTNKNIPIILPDITSASTDIDGTIDANSVDLDPATGGKQTSFSNASGTWTVNASGDVTYVPTLGFTGSGVISYTIADNLGAVSNQAQISITVLNVVSTGNISPVANGDNAITNEDTPVTLPNVTSNDTDADGTIDPATVDLDPLSSGLQTTFTNAQGTWTVNAAGAVTYTPATNFNGSVTKAYTVNDNQGATSNVAIISITVNAVNDAPVASDDNGFTNEDTAVILSDVTANDSDVDGTIDISSVDLDPVTPGKQSTNTTIQGTWSVNGTGAVTYVPAAEFSGNASVTYVVNDNAGTASNTATITIVVSPVNDGPLAINDSGATNEDTPLTLNVTTNDTDPDGTVDVSTVDLDPLTGGKQTTFTNAQGTWTVIATGAVTFAPALNFNGTVSRDYVVKDNSGAISNVAVITITVNAVNDAPVANNDSGTTNEDNALILASIPLNDVDIDGTLNLTTIDLDPVTAGIQNIFTDTQGSWSVDASGVVTYTPVADFNGATSRTYTISDNTGAVSNIATISITVNAVNDVPVLTNLTATTFRNVTATGNMFVISDIDPDGTPLTLVTTPVNAPDNGTILLTSGGNFTYSPNVNFVGSDFVEVQICDTGLPLPSACATKTLTITVIPANSPPVILVNGAPGAAISTTTLEDVPVIFCFDTIDPDGDDVSLGTLTNLAGGGTLSLYNNVKWCFLYTPVLNFNGDAIFEIEVCDNASPSLCGKLTVTITVIPLNDAPVTARDTVTVLRNKPVAGNVLTNDTDVEGDALTATLVTDVAHGRATLSADGSFSYTSDVTFRGIDSLVYKVCDPGVPAACSEETLIIIVDDLPLKIYEGVSPNGDGNNDYLRIEGIDYYVDNEVSIYDRYNNLVFQITDYNNEDRVWKGQANKGVGSSELPEETYFYFINLGDGSPPFKGFVILKRN